MRFTVPLGSIVLLLVFGVSAGAGTRGGYSYAGLSSPAAVGGVAATVSYLEAPRLVAGHVAAWVGVGGPGMGRGGVDEWIQVGLNEQEDSPAAALYFELQRGARYRYGVVASGVEVGERHRFAVLEDRSRRGWWRAWVDGTPAGAAVFLPGSDRAWPGQVVAEEWRSQPAACNAFAFGFSDVAVRAPHKTAQTELAAPIRFADGVALSRSGPGFRASHRCR
jgi:hypothetical protein